MNRQLPPLGFPHDVLALVRFPASEVSIDDTLVTFEGVRGFLEIRQEVIALRTILLSEEQLPMLVRLEPEAIEALSHEEPIAKRSHQLYPPSTESRSIRKSRFLL